MVAVGAPVVLALTWGSATGSDASTLGSSDAGPDASVRSGEPEAVGPAGPVVDVPPAGEVVDVGRRVVLLGPGVVGLGFVVLVVGGRVVEVVGWVGAGGAIPGLAPAPNASPIAVPGAGFSVAAPWVE